MNNIKRCKLHGFLTSPFPLFCFFLCTDTPRRTRGLGVTKGKAKQMETQALKKHFMLSRVCAFFLRCFFPKKTLNLSSISVDQSCKPIGTFQTDLCYHLPPPTGCEETDIFMQGMPPSKETFSLPSKNLPRSLNESSWMLDELKTTEPDHLLLLS